MKVSAAGLVIVLALTIGATACGIDTPTEQRPQYSDAVPAQTSGEVASRAPVLPDNPADRSIRQELIDALDRDTDLRARDISFVVNHGDVSVTGTVRDETERQRINGLAMDIAGVKSVANALRISTEEVTRARKR